MIFTGIISNLISSKYNHSTPSDELIIFYYHESEIYLEMAQSELNKKSFTKANDKQQQI